MPRLLPTALALSLAALPALADSFSGSVDGEARTWHVLEVDGTASAAWSDGFIRQVELFGFPQPGDAGDITGALEISLSLTGEVVAGASVVYYAEGTRGLYTTDDEEAIRVSLSELRAEGDLLHLGGTLEAELFRMVSRATEELDHDDSRRVAASFELTVQARD